MNMVQDLTPELFEKITGKRYGKIGGWAPGDYICRCHTCGCDFTGDKRALDCVFCAIENDRKSTVRSANKRFDAIREVLTAYSETYNFKSLCVSAERVCENITASHKDVDSELISTIRMHILAVFQDGVTKLTERKDEVDAFVNESNKIEDELKVVEGTLSTLRRLYHHLKNGGRTSGLNPMKFGFEPTLENIGNRITELEQKQAELHSMSKRHK